MSSLFSVQVEVATGRGRGCFVAGRWVAMSRAETAGLLDAVRREGQLLCVRFGRHFDTYYLRMPNDYQSALSQTPAVRPGAFRGEDSHAGRSLPPLAVM